ncbi:MAG TPA: metallophosphoesterase family protein [Roseiflexaceae bacterium]|nr:metallophosphoesterase family protein [Roseiflexaceae bacterium]HMP39683.1 metallophosphoesterase family protein [Roseiflexaceae bacterium]
MRYVLLHVSDLHAGPPFNPDLARQLARQAHELNPDLVVVSGDMVQRADFGGQWRTIRAFLDTLPQPRLLVPGNHDVPLFNLYARFFRPLDMYRRQITPDLNPIFERPGLVVVGGVTAHGRTIDGGHLSHQQQQHLGAIFSRYADDVCKVAVLHHHVVNPPGCEGRSTISNAEEVVHLFDRWGVDLLLCGHIHVSYVGTTLDVRPGLTKGTIICQSGTSTSRRGKSRERGKNSYNVIIVEATTIRIIQHLFLEDLGRFAPVAEHVFPHRAAGAYTLA